MLKKLYIRFTNSNELDKAIAISIFVGICITLILIIENREGEIFIILYLSGVLYQTFLMEILLSFLYGVRSYEKENMSYDLEIFIGDKLMDRRN